jgi:hypothetical protein
MGRTYEFDVIVIGAGLVAQQLTSTGCDRGDRV